MADSWYYTHAGSSQGPVSHEQLKQLAAAGNLAPTDLVWPEGGDPRRAVQAQAVLPVATFRPGTDSSGNWLGKVAEALATSPGSPGTRPDWLSDVQQATAGTPTPAPATPAPPPLPPSFPPKSATTRPKPPATEVAPPKAVPVVQPPGVVPGVPYFSRLILSGASSRGKVRERNEDRFQTWQWNGNDAERTHEIALLVVADGMGGYQGGEEASRLTVQTVAQHLSPLTLAGKLDGTLIAVAIDQAFSEANRVVLEQANAEPRWKGMGATAAVVVVWDGRAYFGHVGDCRVYLHRGKELKQLTEDQTLVARMVALGQLSAEEAANHESRNEVTQAVGTRPTIKPSRAEQELVRGDYLLVACDGLAAHVDTPVIEQVLNSPAVPPQHLATQFVNMADEGGGSDNCTVVVAYFA
jgi:PPM family protein phosphatase